jgi:hypothetical protein
MKKITTILSLCFLSLIGFCQSETHNFVTYDTTISIPIPGNPFGAPDVWIVRISRPVNGDTASRPAIITMPGQGQLGNTNTGNLIAFGPHYWLANGWDGSVVLGNGIHYPILITNVYTNNQFPAAWQYYEILSIELNSFHIKRSSVHLGGLSQGAFTEGDLINYQPPTGMSIVTSMVVLEGTPSTVDTADYKVWAAKYHGHYFSLEGNGSDNFRNTWMWARAMNDSVPGSAYFSYEGIGGGGHGNWNQMYDPSATNWTSVGVLGPNNSPSQAGTNTMGSYKGGSIFQWMLRQGDTTLVGGSPVPIPVPPIPVFRYPIREDRIIYYSDSSQMRCTTVF